MQGRLRGRCVMGVMLLTMPCSPGCGPLWEEHCDGVCPARDVGIRVDDGRVRKSIWVDGSPHGFEADFFPFCVLNGPDFLTTHIIKEGKGVSLVVEVDRGAISRIHAFSGDEVYSVDLDSDNKLEYVARSRGSSSLSSYLRLYDESGVEVWGGDAEQWQTLNLMRGQGIDLLVYTEFGFVIVDSHGEVFSRFGYGSYVAATTSQFGGEPVILAYPLGSEEGRSEETWSLDGRLLAVGDREGELPEFRLDGLVFCADQVLGYPQFFGDSGVTVSHTTLRYTSPIGLFIGGNPRGTPENRTIRTGVSITNVQGDVIYEEVYAGGSEENFAFLRGPGTDYSIIFTDGSRLIRFRLP